MIDGKGFGSTNRQTSPCKICVVGAGAAGVELILSIQFRLKKMFEELGLRNSEELSYHLVSKSEQIMPSFPSAVADEFDTILHERGVIVHRGVKQRKRRAMANLFYPMEITLTR